ncbi:MAG: hypothetical protein IPK58_24085 [Acidobacteria bacterium]|nr:hypothetical protein [Acidobacteriota bacterium]
MPLQMGVEAVPVWNTRDLDKFRATLKRVAKIDQVRAVLNLKPASAPFDKLSNPLKTNPRVGLYKGFISSMDEGWTRFVLDNYQIRYSTVSDKDVRGGKLEFDSIILPADGENAIVRGLSAERYPAEIAGGIGEEGVEQLKKWVENGGTLICFDDSCELVIQRFELPMKNVLSGLKRNEFYNPGSIVELDVDRRSNLSRGLNEKTPAYFTNSSAWEIIDTGRVRSVAKYAAKDALMSGWMLGEKHLNGKTALAETIYGKGRIILFGFRPQHRGQTFGRPVHLQRVGEALI